MILKNWVLIFSHKNRIILSLAYAKIKKSQVAYVVFGMVSVEVSFKNYIVALHALQQTKSGPWSKRVWNHRSKQYKCCLCLEVHEVLQNLLYGVAVTLKGHVQCFPFKQRDPSRVSSSFFRSAKFSNSSWFNLLSV